MKSMIVVALALVAVAVAAPVEELPQIVRSSYDQQPEGPYSYAFETSNGITRQEVGELKKALDDENKSHEVIVVRGSYSYFDENGTPLTINYEADENGFRAEGDAIPKPVRR